MNIGEKAYFVGQGNHQPVAVIVSALGESNKVFCKPVDNDRVNAYWLEKQDLFTSLQEVKDACVLAYKAKLGKNLKALNA